MRRAARKDANHREIVSALRAAGRTVVDLSRVGSGCPDILCGWGRTHMVLLEIKCGDNKVMKNQVEWHANWRGTPVAVVRSVDEALSACGVYSARYEVNRR